MMLFDNLRARRCDQIGQRILQLKPPLCPLVKPLAVSCTWLAIQVQFSCYLFVYIAVKWLDALFTVAQFSVAQISGCRCIRSYRDVALFL